MPIGCHLDTDKMAPDQAQELHALVKASGIMSARDARLPAARDVHLFSVEIADGSNKHKVVFDQLSIPPQVRPLIEFLIANSNSMLPD